MKSTDPEFQVMILYFITIKTYKYNIKQWWYWRNGIDINDIIINISIYVIIDIGIVIDIDNDDIDIDNGAPVYVQDVSKAFPVSEKRLQLLARHWTTWLYGDDNE